MVSQIGFLDGISATMVVILGCLFGIISIYKGKKLGVNLLEVAGFIMVFSSLLYLGPLIDFLSLLLTGTNMDNSIGMYGITSYIMIAPAIIPTMYLGARMITPSKKKMITIIYSILGAVFIYFLLNDTMNTFEFTINNPGLELIDAKFNRSSPAFLLIALFLLSILIFLGIGFMIKAKTTTGILRKKFIFLSLAFITFVVSGVFETMLDPGIVLSIVRSGMVLYAALMYLGLKN